MEKGKKCFEAKCGENTDGSPVIIRTCYCGTTGCLKLRKNDYPLPQDFNKVKKITELHPIDRPCKTCGVPKLYQSKNCPNH